MAEKKMFWASTKRDEIINRADRLTLDADIAAFEDRYEDAVSLYDKAIEIMPKNADLWAFKAITLKGGLNRDGEAMDAWNRAIELDPVLTDAVDLKEAENPLKNFEEIMKSSNDESCRIKLAKFFRKQENER